MEENEDCGLNLVCHGREGLADAFAGAIGDLANAVLEATGAMVASLGTMWVYVGTPNLTSTGGRESLIEAGASDPRSGSCQVK
ncbi:hypothetical protein [Antribacter gilvus]|uniref:hypothetical protein n=1 Tax=Antribacter gilvus TaxID=2304675 RepID=UPI000F76D448|nr:hypothetical protein [Antribacter gilvus]